MDQPPRDLQRRNNITAIGGMATLLEVPPDGTLDLAQPFARLVLYYVAVASRGQAVRYWRPQRYVVPMLVA